MIKRIFKKNKIKNKNSFVEPDEIFLDSKNLQNFDRQQFEGRIEKPIPKKTIVFLGILFLIFHRNFRNSPCLSANQKGRCIFKAEAKIIFWKKYYFYRSGNNL